MNELILILSLVVIFGGVILAYRFFGKGGLYAFTVFATVLANIEVLILVRAFGMEQTLGNVLFASTYLITDILSENEGKKSAEKAEAKAEEKIDTDYYSITIPASWQGEYTYDIREGENGSYNLTVRHKDSYGTGYGGMLFSISMYSVAEGNGKQIIEEQPIPIDYLGVLKLPNGGEFDMIVTFPTDLQCPFESIDVYNEFYEEGKSVYKTFTSTNGATFEKA